MNKLFFDLIEDFKYKCYHIIALWNNDQFKVIFHKHCYAIINTSNVNIEIHLFYEIKKGKIKRFFNIKQLDAFKQAVSLILDSYKQNY